MIDVDEVNLDCNDHFYYDVLTELYDLMIYVEKG